MGKDLRFLFFAKNVQMCKCANTKITSFTRSNLIIFCSVRLLEAQATQQ